MMRFLVTDYDDCVARPDSTRSDLLSTTLIKRALNPELNYQGFYGCTHRSSITAYFVKNPLLNGVIRWNFRFHNPEKIAHLSTSRITENFAKATKLTCQTVSMLNDLVLKKCGALYETVIKPYEQSKVSVPWSSFSGLRLLAANRHTKNLQLLQIAQDVAAKHAGVQATLDFFDDKLGLCQKAVDAPKQLHWPQNVKLNIFHHDKRGNLVPVTTPLLHKESYSLGRIGFFATVTTALIYSAATRVYNMAFAPAPAA